MLIVYSAVQRRHRPAYVVKGGLPSQSYDRPERLDSILSAVKENELGAMIEPTHSGLAPILAVHDAGMVEYLQDAYAQHRACSDACGPLFPTFFPPPGQRRRPSCFEGRKGYYCTNMGVPIGQHTWHAALVSAYCAVTGAERLGCGESHVYAMCRPPGHHAGPDFFGGYCYLNNAAIAAKFLRCKGGRVAILDIDYHHGNGTQAVFYRDPGVWYGSLHIDPNTDYPFYAGYADETGEGAGKGTNCNLPLPPGIGGCRYMAALDKLVWQLVSFKPRWLVVSAGFDTYIHDPIGSFRVTTDGFGQIGRRIRRLGIPTLVVQEGGYCVPDLGPNVVAFLIGLTKHQAEQVRRKRLGEHESEKEAQATPAQAKAALSTSTACGNARSVPATAADRKDSSHQPQGTGS
jgi:acetoin utilization deacetylase AcuC-like enzyme